MTDSDFNETVWQFPRALYGYPKLVREKWKELLRKAWKVDSWDEALRDEPKDDVREIPGDIIYDIGGGPIDVQTWDPHWWIGYVDIRPTRSERRETILRDQQLLKNGFKYLWYTIGLLGKHASLPHLYLTADYDVCWLELQRAVANAVVYWLPELCHLSKRFAVGAMPAGWRHSTPTEPPWWIAAVVRSISMGYGKPNEPMAKIWPATFTQHQGDPTQFLKAVGAIIPKDGRFQVATDEH